jgi:hypothetical protein
VKTLDHVEQILGGLLRVGEDEDPKPLVAAGAVIIAAADVGRAPLLAPFQDQCTNAAGAGELGCQ